MYFLIIKILTEISFNHRLPNLDTDIFNKAKFLIIARLKMCCVFCLILISLILIKITLLHPATLKNNCFGLILELLGYRELCPKSNSEYFWRYSQLCARFYYASCLHFKSLIAFFLLKQCFKNQWTTELTQFPSGCFHYLRSLYMIVLIKT